ncbi:MAG: phosphoribosylformylglycinamidine cyclo-ligase [Nitrospirae bacterium]|nr:phosphoribosylformylglycinamidine cyclo-ligase [Nitrospirota bacterium]
MSKETYRSAGVDIDAGDRVVELIKPLVKATFRPEVLADLGGFAGLFRLDTTRYREPVLVSGTDGVGTKLKIANLLRRHDTIGIDLVAMCVNDVIVCGAEPLFFLDYFATGKLDPLQARDVVKGIADGCRDAGCALIGGETAEMPSMYADGEYDLAGFAVGVVERARLIDGRTICPGDAVIGLASSGLHSNGFSLVRKLLFDIEGLAVDDHLPELGGLLGPALLTPTKIYAKTVLALTGEFTLKGIAHITGGGITENLPRILPPGCAAVIDRHRWPPAPIFRLIQTRGLLPDDEMYRTFNMGLGLMLVVAADQADAVRAAAEALGEGAVVVGRIVSGEPGVDYA